MTAATETAPDSGAVKYVTAASMIDCTGTPAHKNPVIVLKGKRIDKIGTKDSIKIPQGADVLDCGQCTLIPGMMDIHLHTMMFNCLTFHNHRVAQWEITPELQQMYGVFHAQLCFDMGFTTLRDLGLNSQRGLLVAEACAIRDAFDAGILEGPRMFVAGFTTITGSHLALIQPRAAVRLGFQTADGPWELRKLARTNLLAGCDVIKTCTTGGGGTDKEEPDIRNMTQEELDAVVDEAHAFHKPCAVHCFTPAGQRMALKAGVDTIEHMVFSDDETIGMIKEAGVWMTPTLAHRTDHAIEVRKSAQALRALWVVGNEYLQEAAPWTAIKTDRDRAAVIVRTALNLAALYARISAPFIPFAAEKIAEAFALSWPPAWPTTDAAAELSALPVGLAVRAPEVLFKKIEDDQIAEWTARFGGAE